MKTSINSVIAIAVLSTLSTQAFANIIWNDSSGNLSDSTRWLGGVVPENTDHAVVNTGFVTIAGNVIVDALTLSNGQINGYGNITTNNFTWLQGNINLDGLDYRQQGVLTVNGDTSIGLNGSAISLAGNWLSSPYACNSCPMTTLVLNGNTAQTK